MRKREKNRRRKKKFSYHLSGMSFSFFGRKKPRNRAKAHKQY